MSKLNYIVCGTSRGADVANTINDLIDRATFEVLNLKALPLAPTQYDTWVVKNRSTNLQGFGGVYAWEAGKSKAQHDGKRVIAPEAIAAWDGTSANVNQLLNWTGTGSGAYVAVALSPELVDDGIGAAQAAAISAAATDATTKANAAKSEAIAEAAIDATTKANAAKSEAIAEAAIDATNKVGDAVAGIAGENVRVKLANPETVSEALDKRVINVSHLKALPVADLHNGSQYSVAGFYAGTNVGGGMFVYDASRSKSDHNGVTIIDPDKLVELGDPGVFGSYFTTSSSGSGCFVRPKKSEYLVEDAGGHHSLASNTTAYNGLIAALDDGTKIVWGSPNRYIGHFISESKSFVLDLNQATLTNDLSNLSICQIGSFAVDEYAVSESELNYRANQFTVSGASSLFSVGDIGYLWDGAVRPAGGKVNFEVVKIQSIAGDVITVVGFLASYKGASAIKFYHSPVQLKNPSISNGHIVPNDTHTTFGAVCLNAENPRMFNIYTKNTTGNAVAARYCYGLGVWDIRPNRPRATGGGQGYGLALFGVSRYFVRDVHGDGCRHVYDQDSAYFGDIQNVSDMDDKSSPVVLAHNGFAGYVSCRNVRVKTGQYPVVFSSQGYGDGSTNAERGNHPFRSININGVDAIINTSVNVNSSNVLGVYFQNSVDDAEISNIKVNLLNETELATNANTYVIRVDGIARGVFNIENIRVNKIGAFFFSNGNRGSLEHDGCITRLRNLKAEAVDYVVRTQGAWAVDIDAVSIESGPQGKAITFMQRLISGAPRGAYIGGSLNFNGVDVELLRTIGVGTILGSLPSFSKAITSSIVVSSGYALSQAEIQNRSTLVRITSPIGSGTVTLSDTEALPAPVVLGAELFITQQSAGRQAVEFPSGNNIVTGFTIGAQETVRLLAMDGKWQLFGRYQTT